MNDSEIMAFKYPCCGNLSSLTRAQVQKPISLGLSDKSCWAPCGRGIGMWGPGGIPGVVGRVHEVVGGRSVGVGGHSHLDLAKLRA